MSELHKGLARISSNYTRLAITLVLGLFLVRVLLITVGEEVTGLIDLLGSTIGLAAIIEEIISWSMVRELGVAHHSGKNEYFKKMFNSALVVSAGSAAATIGVHGLILFVLPLIDIPPSYLNAASWFVVAKGIESALMVLLSPFFNMYLVTEKQIQYNFWLAARRSSLLFAAVTLFGIDTSNTSYSLIWLGWISCFFHVAIISISVYCIIKADRRLIPALGSARREEIRSIIRTNSWNIALLGSQWLGLPAAQVFLNLQSGLYGNLVLGRASQIGGYVRMLTTGINHGLDAVSVRLSSNNDSNIQEIKSILYHSTRLHAIVVFPISIGLAMFADPIFDLWIGKDVKSIAVLQAMALTTRLLLIAFIVMSLSDNWIKILYGAGHVRRYVPSVIMGGVIYIPLALFLSAYFPSSIKFAAFASAFSGMYLVCYMGFIPRIVAVTFGIKIGDVLSPLVRPLLAAIASSPLSIVLFIYTGNLGFADVGIGLISYASCYAALCWFIVLSSEERSGILRLVCRWINCAKMKMGGDIKR